MSFCGSAWSWGERCIPHVLGGRWRNLSPWSFCFWKVWNPCQAKAKVVRFLGPALCICCCFKMLGASDGEMCPGQWRALGKLEPVWCWVISSWVMGHGKGWKWGLLSLMCRLCWVFFWSSTTLVRTFCLQQEHLQVLHRRSRCLWGWWLGCCTHPRFSPRLITSLLDSLRWLWQVLCFPSSVPGSPSHNHKVFPQLLESGYAPCMSFYCQKLGKWTGPTQINFSRAGSQNTPGLVWWKKVNHREIYELLLTRLCWQNTVLLIGVAGKPPGDI